MKKDRKEGIRKAVDRESSRCTADFICQFVDFNE
jgi:hypothetical protein